MCNKGFQCLKECESEVDHRQELFVMDSPIRSPAAGSGSGEESRRVKFLCSFLGSIMPRPQDGKLRYVGGETRIVSVCRDISYEELMVKMRELYDGAAVLKYQQPDEDLDALVSVVNDDDVVNMMEEYDKLGSGDGFTRLRIFLFSQSEQDGSSHFIDGDDSERRYVDALNSLNDVADFRRMQQGEFPMISPVEDIHVAAEQFFNPMSVESGIHSHRSGDLSMPPYNMHHLSIQHPQTVGPRYTEMDSPWNPAYYSPRHHGLHDSRSLVEFPSSPSGRYRMPFPELPDKCIDRGPEDYARHHVNHHPLYDNQQQYADNVLWVPTGAAHSEKTGFPGNILHGSHVVDGNNICEQCRMGFQRGQPHLEHSNISNGLLPVANPCGECPLPNRDAFPMNVDAKLHPAMYPSEPNGDHRSVYNDTQNHERGWGLHHPTTARVEESRGHLSVSGRVGDVPVANISLGHGSVTDGHALSSNYLHQPVGPELGTELFPDQTLTTSPHVQIAPLEECNVRYGNPSSPYGVDSNYAVPRGHPSGLWRNSPIPVHLGPSYEANTSPPQVNGMINAALVRGEGSPGFYIGPDTQNQWVDSSQKLTGQDCKAIPEYSHAHALQLNPTLLGPENRHPVTVDTIHPPQDVSTGTCLEPLQAPISSYNMVHNQEVLRNDTSLATAKTFESNTLLGEGIVVKIEDKVKGPDTQTVSYSEQNKVAENACPAAPSVDSNNSKSKPEGDCRLVEKLADEDHSVPQDYKHLGNQLSLLPELIASVKRNALEVAEEVKTAAKDDPANSHNQNLDAKEKTINEVEPANANGDLELNSESDHVDTSKIEPTKAEEEAIARGLQTIKNDDLEEIRELGSGTYGAVYHGKWKGSDVAIKRIKASCFAGRPSERARLITDFWKEALMLSSLHHPNVVSFYGIVRDGPDSSLATVTEFMINGSLKQFLHKKDRTIDRRKRLIIAMDAAFGMEYLHGKNIVHFDLKCENLLVNMRDPQRPVCKIGDLGLSKVKQHTLVSGGVRGTLPWMAPELLSGKSNMVSEKIDVYSFGVVMWELLTGDEPYADMHCASIIGGIVNNSLRPQIPSWCDPEWKSLMESCWASDPAERPSFSEISKKLRSMAASMNVK